MSQYAFDRLAASDASSPKRIAVVGDALTDVYVYGKQMPCQDDCFKFVEESRVEVDGGAANAADCLFNWRSQGECFANTGIVPQKIRFLVNDRIVYRHDVDDSQPLGTKTASELGAMWEWQPHAILISDYDKGFLSRQDIRNVIDEARRKNIIVVADAKRPPEVYNGSILKCNKAYADEYAGSLAGRPGTIITNGAGSPVRPSTTMPFINADTMGCWLISSRVAPVKCVNHVGAGDCFGAHLTLALAHGLSLDDAAVIAHSAGRVYVQHPHNRAPYPDEIRVDLTE